MRRSLGKLSSPVIGNATKNTLIIASSSAFSTSSGGGGGGGGGSGRGRGRGSSVIGPSDSQIPPLPGNPEAAGDDDDPKGGFISSPLPSGLGHGRGKPLPSSTPTLPSYSSFISAVSSTGIDGDGAGRGRATAPPPPHPRAEPEQFGPKRPIFFTKEEPSSDSATTKPVVRRDPLLQDNDLPSGILSVLSGAGRGKPAKQSVPDAKAKEENRHRRPSKPGGGIGVGSTSSDGSLTKPKLSREEAVKKAVGILSKGGFVEDTMEDGGRGRGGFRGRGTRGRGSQGWRGRGRGRGRGRDSRVQDGDNDFGDDFYLGDDADGEKLAKTLGPDKMNQLVEAFEEMSGRVLPSPMEDAYLDALHTNYMIECEPEYLMEDFGTNPDIDEKPPISLADALEKMKPFLMAYEEIQSQSEWEEVVKEAMERVPNIKELVDYYSGPDRVTAKKQHEELERVAKTLPKSAPASLKRFTERAVLSLQVGVVSACILLIQWLSLVLARFQWFSGTIAIFCTCYVNPQYGWSYERWRFLILLLAFYWKPFGIMCVYRII
ncbi:uncharacterized protein LOC131301690 isoform X1 [Rhododendron vialii]|uniref:uncharacterized protein LOC131301690 isoform X1 n=1 Tax=Rhododendron vialii TaxID=182163 RepID=UPI00265DD044|nr:uncharacterized protein LOC131301690 isoform X1 [Rhododendron vialii]